MAVPSRFCKGSREEGSESALSRKSPTACHMHLPSNSKSISLEALLCNGFCLKRNLHCPPFQFSLSSPSDCFSLLVSSQWWVIWGVNCSVLLCPVRFERKHWEATLRCQHAYAHGALHGAAMPSFVYFTQTICLKGTQECSFSLSASDWAALKCTKTELYHQCNSPSPTITWTTGKTHVLYINYQWLIVKSSYCGWEIVLSALYNTFLALTKLWGVHWSSLTWVSRCTLGD